MPVSGVLTRWSCGPCVSKLSIDSEPVTLFRPCIDLHQGRVKQIVGGTLRDEDCSAKENHVSDRSADWFAKKYLADGLSGGHVIKLGPGNEEAARAALVAYPGGLQLGGGITNENAKEWLDAGASHVIVTSWLFNQAGVFQEDHLRELARSIGRERIVIDLSCRRTSDDDDHPTWHVAMNRWQTVTRLEICDQTLSRLSEFADEFLIHAADVEGLCGGVDELLVEKLGQWAGLPMTYAGGVANLRDVEFIDRVSGSMLDFTVGSSLDLFGGKGVKYKDLLGRNRQDL